MKSFAVAFLALILLSCAKSGSDIEPLDGTYIGYYHKSGQDTSLVSIHFNNYDYDGQSSISNYPSIGKGSFDQNGKNIFFSERRNAGKEYKAKDQLIGLYNYEINDDGTIRIWRESTNSSDEYILKKPVREELKSVVYK